MADGIKKFFTDRSNFNDDDLEFYLGIEDERVWIKIPDMLDYDDYAIGSTPRDGFYTSYISDFQKYRYSGLLDSFEGGEKTTFNNLSDLAKFSILANTSVGFNITATTINPDDEDYSILTNMFTNIQREYKSSSGEQILKNFIKRRIEEVFGKLYENSKTGDLEDGEMRFFKKYSTLIPDEPITRKVRIALLKQEGESEYIFSNFGIRNRFSLQAFADQATLEFREYVDLISYINFIEDFPPGLSPYNTYSVNGNYEFRYLVENAFKGANNNLTSFKKITITKDVAEEYSDSFKRLTDTIIEPSEVKNSEVYLRPTNFDNVFMSKGENQSNSFYDLNAQIEGPTGRNYRLGDLFDPTGTSEQFRLGWFAFGERKTTGSDDVTFGFYIAFLDDLRFSIEQSGGTLERNIGQTFNHFAKKLALHLYFRLLIVYENNVRVGIAKVLGDKKALEKVQSDADLIKSAEEASRNDLAALETSEIFKEDVTEEDISNREKKYKQCVLMMNIPTLSNNYRQEVLNKFRNNDPMHSEKLYNGRFTMVSDGNLSNQNLIVNKLLVPKAEKIESFLNMTPELYAALQPKIRLHKVYYDPSESDTNPHIVREIPFRAHTSTERVKSLLNGNTFDKGDGVGIKSFNFSFDGETPATSTKFIKAKLELFFQTFADFIRERTITDGDVTYSFRYVDLFVNTRFCPRMGANEGANTNSPLHYDPNHYRIRADVGYEIPKDINSILNRPGVVSGGESKIGEVQEAIKVINKSFYLNLIDHDINIADDGTVNISAEYIAYMEGATGTKIMNALNSKEARKFEQDQIQIYEQALKENKCDKKQLSELRASIQGARQIARQKMYQSLVEKLILNGCLYSCFINKFSRKKFSNEQFFYEKPQLVEISKEQSNNSSNVTKTVESEVGDGKTIDDRWSYITANYLADNEPQLGTKVNFFYFADLVYFLLDSLYKEENEFFPEVENIKVILTSFTLDLLGENSETLINIGEIPIDLDTFIEWFKENILDKDIEAISIIDFIKRFFLYLIKDVFQETCVDTDQQKKLSFKTMSVMAIDRENPGSDPLQNMLQKDLNATIGLPDFDSSPILNVVRHYNKGNLPLITSAVDRKSPKTSDFINYMMIFVHYRPTKFTGLGIKNEDETKGIYHFFVGADKGLVKNINFSKADIQYIRESRMMNQGTNNLLQLSSVYRSSIKMIGNTLLYPGMELFINPFGFGGPVFGHPEDGPGDINSPNLSNIMGIGGYQQVLKVNSTISPGKFETTVDCIFIHSGEAEEYHESSTGIRSVTNNKLRGLCSIDDPAIDTPSTEDINACNDLITDVQNALLNYSQTGTIDLKSEE